MPTQLGHFISRHVYAGRLKTSHNVNALSAVRFVDIRGAESSYGRSWIVSTVFLCRVPFANPVLQNLKEVQAVVHLARVMQATGKSFRIITPYDPQRSKIEDALKVAKLKWEDKVFNVDSFQGNEDDYIIVSLVRSVKVGFLSNQRRTNVMLSRCKKGMVICANKAFLTGDAKARKTLVGKLAAEWMAAGAEWVEWSDLLGGRM
jgi:superfamily I DNA and/or RNA helicase